MTFFRSLEHLYALGLTCFVLYQNWNSSIVQGTLGKVADWLHLKARSS